MIYYCGFTNKSANNKYMVGKHNESLAIMKNKGGQGLKYRLFCWTENSVGGNDSGPKYDILNVKKLSIYFLHRI